MVLSSWITTLSLIFGGCCSNAITLEQLTSGYPQAGSLITFLQFLVISLHGLPKHVIWTRYGPRFKPRRIPLTPYLIQVALFYFVSLLNNAAFAYRIPMAVHIIFRSGGLVISMTLGWLVGKKYTRIQILSVVLVTFGVALTTLSASANGARSNTKTTTIDTNPYTYATGIAILSFALLLSGILGLVQDETYAKYGRPSLSRNSNGAAMPDSAKSRQQNHSAVKPEPTDNESSSAAWQESMFYLHLLALPLFIPIRKDLASQLNVINAGSCFTFSIPLSTPFTHKPSFTSVFPYLHSSFLYLKSPFISLSSSQIIIRIPNTYLSLLVNTLTQLLCVGGVHRLTTRVSALTVTLVLVVRKAASLVLSVVGVSVLLGLGDRTRSGNSERRVHEVDIEMICVGATMVLLGTVGYAVTTSANSKDKRE